MNLGHVNCQLAEIFFEHSWRRSLRQVPIETRLEAASKHVNAVSRIDLDVIGQIAQSCRVGRLAVIAMIGEK